MPEPGQEFEDEGTDGFPICVCPNCESAHGHAPRVCRECGSETFEDETLPGRGQIYANTVIRVPGADHQGEEPFTVALIDIDGSPAVRVTGRIDGAERLPPGSDVAYLGRRDETFWFRATN